jgi:hypothetical protein
LDSNETDNSDLQSEKHDGQRISTFDGIKIDRSDESENADDSIRVNCEFDSNEIDENDGRLSEHDELGISTWPGISID